MCKKRPSRLCRGVETRPTLLGADNCVGQRRLAWHHDKRSLLHVGSGFVVFFGEGEIQGGTACTYDLVNRARAGIGFLWAGKAVAASYL